MEGRRRMTMYESYEEAMNGLLTKALAQKMERLRWQAAWMKWFAITWTTVWMAPLVFALWKTL